MRYAVLPLTLVLLIFATPLSAGWWPSWSTTDVQIYVGEKVFVRVTPTWSGLADMGGIHWNFASDNPAVATGSVQLEDSRPHDFNIIGVTPGVAHIRSNGGSGWSYVTVRVFCPENSAITAIAAEPVVRAELGREVRLMVVTEFENQSTFRWYLGKIGDTSRPLGRSSAEATFTADSYGSQYVWAEVTSVCATAHVQFRVDVYARGRSVRH